MQAEGKSVLRKLEEREFGIKIKPVGKVLLEEDTFDVTLLVRGYV